MVDHPSILVASRPGYRVITFNRPQRLNAFTEEMHLGLRAALDDAQADRPAVRCCSPARAAPSAPARI